MNIKELIPTDWQLVKLKDVSELITKGTTPTTNGYSYLDEGINFVKVESIHANGTFIPRMFAHVGEDCHNSFKRSQLNSNDILFTIAGALGRSAIVNNDILPANTNQAVAIIRLKKAEYVKYVFHYLRGNYIKNLIEKINVSTAQANLSLGQMNQFEIPYPPIPEQQKIAEILSTVDAKIEVIDQQITETQALKKGLMQRLLTKGIGHTEFKDSPLGKIPKSWQVKNLGDISEVKGRIGYRGYTKADLVEKGQGALAIGGAQINNQNRLNLSNPVYLTWEKYEESPEIKVEEGNIVFAQRGTLGRTALIESLPELATINPSMVLIKNITCNNMLLYYYLCSSHVQNIVTQISTATAVPMISQKQIKEFKIGIPPKDEQQKIAEILISVDEKLEVLNEKKTYYQELKQGLMQKLLTGQIRVNTH